MTCLLLLTHKCFCSSFGICCDSFAISPALVLAEELRDVLNDGNLDWCLVHPATTAQWGLRMMLALSD